MMLVMMIVMNDDDDDDVGDDDDDGDKTWEVGKRRSGSGERRKSTTSSNDKKNRVARGLVLKASYLAAMCLWHRGGCPVPDWEGAIIQPYSLWQFRICCDLIVVRSGRPHPTQPVRSKRLPTPSVSR